MTLEKFLVSSCVLAAATACSYSGSAATADSADAVIEVIMGDGQINGSNIEPYEFEWVQCSFQGGSWVTGPSFRETLAITQDGRFELAQRTQGGQGRRTTMTHILDRETLMRTEVRQKVEGPDGAVLGNAALNFTDMGYSVIVGGDERPGGAISSTMYGGAYLGLSLSTLDFSRGGYALDAGMLAVKGTYRVEARRVGVETIYVNDQAVEAQLVDVRWLHHESGDIYQPGPDAAGGRYWLSSSQPKGLPRVLAYKTDSYAIEFTPMTCA